MVAKWPTCVRGRRGGGERPKGEKHEREQKWENEPKIGQLRRGRCKHQANLTLRKGQARKLDAKILRRTRADNIDSTHGENCEKSTTRLRSVALGEARMNRICWAVDIQTRPNKEIHEPIVESMLQAFNWDKENPSINASVRATE